MTEYLSTEDLLGLVDALRVGPVRDPGLLDSAAHRPGTWVLGVEAYSTLAAKAAVLLESVVANRSLVDGNKRLGWLAVVVFPELNGIVVDAPDDDAYDLVMAVAAGAVGYSEVASTLGPWF